MRSHRCALSSCPAIGSDEGTLAGAPCIFLGGFDCGGLALAPPFLPGFVADQRARTDLHRGRPPPLALHLVELVFRNTVQAAELFDRHCERVRVRAHRPSPVLRTISSGGPRLCPSFARSAVGLGFLPVTSARAIAIASMKLYGGR